jgi:hypothetical protein
MILSVIRKKIVVLALSFLLIAIPLVPFAGAVDTSLNLDPLYKTSDQKETTWTTSGFIHQEENGNFVAQNTGAFGVYNLKSAIQGGHNGYGQDTNYVGIGVLRKKDNGGSYSIAGKKILKTYVRFESFSNCDLVFDAAKFQDGGPLYYSQNGQPNIEDVINIVSPLAGFTIGKAGYGTYWMLSNIGKNMFQFYTKKEDDTSKIEWDHRQTGNLDYVADTIHHAYATIWTEADNDTQCGGAKPASYTYIDGMEYCPVGTCIPIVNPTKYLETQISLTRSKVPPHTCDSSSIYFKKTGSGEDLSFG